ncbi:MAG: hypothetical protein EBX50_14100 [Chitinophagia bacterium]|nr:hypothetical protein [Chitinophagia bacterium]
MLAKIEQLATLAAQMTLVVGRPRIGKTSLISKAFSQSKLFLFGRSCWQIWGGLRPAIVPADFPTEADSHTLTA